MSEAGGHQGVPLGASGGTGGWWCPKMATAAGIGAARRGPPSCKAARGGPGGAPGRPRERTRRREVGSARAREAADPRAASWTPASPLEARSRGGAEWPAAGSARSEQQPLAGRAHSPGRGGRTGDAETAGGAAATSVCLCPAGRAERSVSCSRADQDHVGEKRPRLHHRPRHQRCLRGPGRAGPGLPSPDPPSGNGPEDSGVRTGKRGSPRLRAFSVTPGRARAGLSEWGDPVVVGLAGRRVGTSPRCPHPVFWISPSSTARGGRPWSLQTPAGPSCAPIPCFAPLPATPLKGAFQLWPTLPLQVSPATERNKPGG